MRNIILLGVVLAAFGAVRACAQWETDSLFDYHTQKGISAVYNLDLPQADTEFTEMIRLRPGHPAGHFFKAMIVWERIAIDIDNESYDDELHEKLEKVIDLCDEILDREPDNITALFFKGGAIGFRGRLRANRNQWLRAANDGRLALPIVRKIRELSPDNYDALLGTGIYDYFAEVAPAKYPVIKPFMIFFPNGDKQRGIEALRAASEKAKYAAVEATYFLMQVYYMFEHQPANALPLAARLHTRFPNNPQFERYLGRCYVQLDILPEVMRIFTDMKKKAVQKYVGYDQSCIREAEYYIGMVHFKQRQYEQALGRFYAADSLCRILDRKDGPSGFMTMTNLRIGQIYDIQGRRDYALQQYRKVLALTEFENAHQLAEQYSQSPYQVQ